jgi:hypothetical protein
MKKLIAIAALVALFPFSASAFESQTTLTCADGKQIVVPASGDTSVFYFAQKFECKYHGAKSLVEIFKDNFFVFVK